VTAAAGERLIVGRVATLSGHSGLGIVEAVAVRSGRVVAAGRVGDVEGAIGGRARRIQLAPDEVAIPGLTDAHLHLADAAKEATETDLADAPSREAGMAAIAREHADMPAGRWLEGRGWSADRWRRWPTADDLEATAPGRAVALWQHDHHALWVSHEAMAIADIGPGTPDPPGGSIVRDVDGRPTGVLLEDASLLVANRIPALDADALVDAIPATVRGVLSLGVVAVHDPATLLADPRLERAIAAYRRLDERGELPIRVLASVRYEALETVSEQGVWSGGPLSATPDPRVRLGWLKLFADGTLGSRTAAMLEPFEDAGGRGIFRTPPSALSERSRMAGEQGIATQIHAIGDAAVRAALDALELAPARRLRLRPRVEHVQLVSAADLPRFARAGIAASVQPSHLIGDAPAARVAWGDRAERFGYPWRALAQSGAILPFGTDAPVESGDPWPGIAISVSRRHPGWAGVDDRPFGPANALDLDRALRAACVDPALVAGETDRGRLQVGHRADLVVLPWAALAEPVEPDGPLATVKPRLVLVDGEVAFER
jgi:predicted amidohydrolase YtcJ